MITYPHDASDSNALAAKRQRKAAAVLGQTVVARIIGFALFLMGLKRKEIAQTVGIDYNTLLSFLTRMNDVGLEGLRDRRKKADAVHERAPLQIQIIRRNGENALVFSPYENEIVLSGDNPVQTRVLALTLATNGLLSWEQASELVGSSSPEYLRRLGRRLVQEDVDAVTDKRTGQVQDYRVGPEEKGRLIVQWAANAATGRDCSSRALAADLQQGSAPAIPDRTIRHHMKKLGLVRMHKPLSSLISSIKKTSDHRDGGRNAR